MSWNKCWASRSSGINAFSNIGDAVRIAQTILLFVFLIAGGCAANKAAPTTHPAPNAADLYRQAFASLPDSTHEPILRDWDSVALDGSTAEFLKQHAAAIDLFRQATAINNCDWGKLVEGRTYTAVARLAPARSLRILLQLNARQLIKDGHVSEAFDDFARLLTMSRQVAAGDVVVARLSTDAHFDAILSQVAQALPDTPPDIVRAFARAWKAQPAPEPYTAALRREMPFLKPVLTEVAKEGSDKLLARDGELTMMISFTAFDETDEQRAARVKVARDTWLDPQKRQAAIDALPALWEESIRVLELPAYKYQAAFNKLQKRIEDHPFYFFAPQVEFLHDRAKSYTVRRAFLDAALAIALDGKEAVATIPDPASDGPFRYTESGRTYELRSELETNGHQEVQRSRPRRPGPPVASAPFTAIQAPKPTTPTLLLLRPRAHDRLGLGRA